AGLHSNSIRLPVAHRDPSSADGHAHSRVGRDAADPARAGPQRAPNAAVGIDALSRLLLRPVAGAHRAPADRPRRMSPLTIIFITIFIDLIGFGIIIPLMPFYAETFGATAVTVGLLSTSFSFMQFVFAPIWGRLSDRIGRRPVILIGLFGSFASYML